MLLTSDGGGKVSAARRPVYGSDSVGRFLLGILAKAVPGQWVRAILVNGVAGFVFMDVERVDTLASLTVRSGRIVRVDLVRAPGKLPTI